MDTGKLIALIATLDGRPMRTRPGNWNARFDGAVDVAGVRRAGERVIFTVTVPTGPTDHGDFINQSELDAGTTDKIQIVARNEDGSVTAPLPLAVKSVLRAGPGERWPGPVDAYVFRLELGPVDVELFGPLAVRLVSDGSVIAEAIGGRSDQRGINDVLVPTVITLPLWDLLAHAPLDEEFDVVIDVSWNAGTSPGAALASARKLITTVASPDGSADDAATPSGVDQYLFARLTRQQIQTLVERDKESPDGPLLHRIWPDFPVQPLLERSVIAVKADAARSSFGAAGRDVTWAVIDSGIAPHPHFDTHHNLTLHDRRMRHRDFITGRTGTAALVDEFGHGTHVAGIIAGERPSDANGSAWACVSERDEAGVVRERLRPVHEIRGIAPEATLVSLRVLDADGNGPVRRVMEALDYVDRVNEGGRVVRIHGVNLSVGYEFDPEWFACGHSPLCSQIDRLVRTGVVVVVAAGNTGYGRINAAVRPTASAGIDLTINDPGNAERAITVGSTHAVSPHTFGVSYFSSKGPTGDGRLKPDLLAPGERIVSCAAGRRTPTPNGDAAANDAYYVEDSGTSMAAPHVSGAVAAFLSIRSEYREQPDRVKQLFMDTATDLGREHYFQGRGMLDLMRAIQAV
jgi:subtilisin family serine protease